jgi:tetratricopeptide (TPR) repeat protein
MAKTSILIACAALAIMLAAPRSAGAAPKPNAKVHIDRATKAHKAGDLDKALTELQAAYAIDPQPQILYAIGQIFTKLGRCSEASDAYLRFLASGADPSTAQVVKQAIESCKPPSAAEPATVQKATPTPTPPPPSSPATDDELPPGKGPSAPVKKAAPPPEKMASPPAKSPPRKQIALNRDLDSQSSPPESGGAKPWYRDVLGDVLVVGGVTSLVLSGLAYRAAVTDVDTAEKATNHDKYKELIDGAKTKRLVGVALASGGAVLVTAGLLRFALRDKHTEVRRVGLAPARGGGLLTWTRSF